MTFRPIVHEAEEGGYWAEVPAIPGCATQGETIEELEANVIDAIKGCLSVEVEPVQLGEGDRELGPPRSWLLLKTVAKYNARGKLCDHPIQGPSL